MADVDFNVGSDNGLQALIDDHDAAYGIDSSDFDGALTPLERLSKYLDSDQCYYRQTIVQSLLDILRQCEQTSGDVTVVFNAIVRLSDDNEGIIRAELVKRIYTIIKYCKANANQSIYRSVVETCFLPVVIKLLSDYNREVRKGSLQTLLKVIRKHLIEQGEIEYQVLPCVIQLSDQESPDDFRAESILLMASLGRWCSQSMVEQIFLPRFVDMCSDAQFQVRKACALKIGTICKLVGPAITESQLLSRFIILCKDGVWGVRKACIECFVDVANCCSRETRRDELIPLFIGLIKDQSRWVRMAGFQAIGGFISTFADSSRTGLFLQLDGTVIFKECPSESEISNIGAESSTSDCSVENLTSGSTSSLTEVPSPRVDSEYFRSTSPSSDCDMVIRVEPSPEESVSGGNISVEDSKGLDEIHLVDSTRSDLDRDELKADDSSESNDSLSHVEQMIVDESPEERVVDGIVPGSSSIVDDSCTLGNGELGELDEAEKSCATLVVDLEGVFIEPSGSDGSVGAVKQSKDDMDQSTTNGCDDAVNDCQMWGPPQGKCPVVVGESVANAESMSSEPEFISTLRDTEVEEDISVDREPKNEDVSGTSEGQEMQNVIIESPQPVISSDIDAADVSSAADAGSVERVCSKAPGSAVRVHTASLNELSEPVEEMAAHIGSTRVHVADELNVVNGVVKPVDSGVKIDVARTPATLTLSDIASVEATKYGNGMHESGRDVLDTMKEASGRHLFFIKNAGLARFGLYAGGTSNHEPLIPADVVSSADNSLDQTIVPQVLLNHFVGMVDPRRAQTADCDIACHCAYSLPAVTYTIGRHNWPHLEQLFHNLARDMQWKVRRTLACSLHQMAAILGSELTKADILPVFEDFMRDVDEVRTALVRHMYDFLQLVSPIDCSIFISKLPELLVVDNTRNWRFRQSLAKQLILLTDVLSITDIWEHVLPIVSSSLAKDHVAQVRQSAAELLSSVLWRLATSDEDQRLSDLANQAVLSFAQSSCWTERQLFVSLCDHIFNRVTQGQEADHVRQHVVLLLQLVLEPLLLLHVDRVANVRIALSRCLSKHFISHVNFVDGELSLHQSSLELSISTLHADKDVDVRYLISHAPVEHSTMNSDDDDDMDIN